MLNDIYDCLRQDYSDDEVLEIFYELASMGQSELLEFIEEKCNRLELCPECFSELKYKEYMDKEEYWGAMISIPMTERFCDCGYSE